MVSAEAITVAAETLKAFTPEVLRAAVIKVPGLEEVMANNNNNNNNKVVGQ